MVYTQCKKILPPAPPVVVEGGLLTYLLTNLLACLLTYSLTLHPLPWQGPSSRSRDHIIYVYNIVSGYNIDISFTKDDVLYIIIVIDYVCDVGSCAVYHACATRRVFRSRTAQRVRAKCFIHADLGRPSTLEAHCLAFNTQFNPWIHGRFRKEILCETSSSASCAPP